MPSAVQQGRTQALALQPGNKKKRTSFETIETSEGPFGRYSQSTHNPVTGAQTGLEKQNGDGQQVQQETSWAPGLVDPDSGLKRCRSHSKQGIGFQVAMGIPRSPLITNFIIDTNAVGGGYASANEVPDSGTPIAWGPPKTLVSDNDVTHA